MSASQLSLISSSASRFTPLGLMEWRAYLQEAQQALGRGELHEALQLCDRAAHGGGEARYHAVFLRGDTLMRMGDSASALSAFDSIADPAVADPDLDCARGIALLELGHLPEADNALRSALRGKPELAGAYYGLGLLAEIMGTGEDVELFRRARRLDPERYPATPQLTRNAFEEIIDQAVAGLPEDLRGQLSEIPVLVAEVPTPEQLKSMVPPTALGVFAHGGRQNDGRGAILLFKRNLERAFPERHRLIEELRRTISCELAPPQDSN